MSKAQTKHQKDCIGRLRAILRMPNADLHHVGCAGATFRKVVMALQRPYVAEGDERDDSLLHYKLYVVLDGELADITPLVAVAIGVNVHKSGNVDYGISEKIGTGFVSNALRRAIEKKGEHFPVWVL